MVFPPRHPSSAVIRPARLLEEQETRSTEKQSGAFIVNPLFELGMCTFEMRPGTPCQIETVSGTYCRCPFCFVVRLLDVYFLPNNGAAGVLLSR